MSSDPVVAPCGPADRAEQARLFNQCFQKPIDAAGLAWRYDANPRGASVSFVTRVGGEAVSGYACSPRLALASGAESTAATIGETGDVMTHPAWRKRGLFSALDAAAREETARRGWSLMFGLPNRRSAHLFVELGWRSIGTIRPWTHLLAGGSRGRAIRAREGRLAALLAPLAVRAGRRGRRRLAAAGSGLAARELERFPSEVVDVARAVEPRFAWMVRRDAPYLDWRFLAAPSGLFRAIGIFDGARLAGYAVVQVPRPGDEVGHLVDVLGRDDAAVDAAVAAGLERLEREGAAAVQATAIDGSWWRARLVRAGFVPPRPDHHWIVIAWIHDERHPLAAAARDASAWYLTDGDRDDETMG